MSEPLSLETILAEFSESDQAWVLRDAHSGDYVTIPHERYPGRTILHFFMSRDDAARILEMIVEKGNQKIATAMVVPVRVNLLESLRGIAATTKVGYADSYVVHPPNEVFEYWWPQSV